MSSSYISRFLEMMGAEVGAAKATLCAYEADLKDWKKFLGEKDMHLVVSDDIQNYLAILSQTGMASTTISRRLSVLKRFYLFSLAEGNITQNPTESILRPQSLKPLPKTLEEDEIFHLLQLAKKWEGPEGYRAYALLELLYASGMRVSELVSTRYSAVVESLKNDRMALVIQGKGDKERLVPLNQAAIEALKAYLNIRSYFFSPRKDSVWLFPSTGAGGHLTRQRFGQILKELAIRAGIDPARLSPHTIRHAFATHLLKYGTDLLTVQKLLGHSDISTTQIYTHILYDDLKNLVETYHPLAQRKRDQ